MISLREVCKSFRGAAEHRVLCGVNLSLASGEYIAIMGESGSGKSTLLNLIAGIDTPDLGAIEFDGEDLSVLDDEARTRLRARKMGFVFQAFHLLPHLSALQNVALVLALNGVKAAAAEQRARAMLDAVGLSERAESYPRELSGGEMQRVAIARALVHEPALVLADEPTGNLDAASAAAVLALLRARVTGSGASGILVTHSLAAARTTERIYELRDGALRPLAAVGETNLRSARA